jgi:hypothetical protein
MERCLENGGRAVASAEALLALDGHRARDMLVRVIHHYLRDEPRAARALLDDCGIGSARLVKRFHAATAISRWLSAVACANRTIAKPFSSSFVARRAHRSNIAGLSNGSRS